MPFFSSSLPRVALVGRTNVGKSTLWNRLTESSQALVSDEPHTTRDRKYGRVLWRGQEFELVDTGGMDTESNEIGENILLQSKRAIEQADLVLFLVDGKQGVLLPDQTLARGLQSQRQKTWLVANKIDTVKDMALTNEPELFKLHFGMAHAVSATTGLGIGDLLDAVLVELDKRGRPVVPVEDKSSLKIALVGRPNVGKSSLTNAILGEPRVIVSPVAHTTREPQDTVFGYQDKNIVLIDTAGMRKQAHMKQGLEEAGVERNKQAIEAADVALLVFDATEDPSAQDRHLAGYLEASSKGLILIANKWDLVEAKKTKTAQEYEARLRSSFPFLDWAPMIFVSALNKKRTHLLLDEALKIQAERERHIDYNALNRLLKSCIKAMKPLASYGPKSPRIYDVAQIDHRPPTFLITVHGEKENIHPNWIKFFEKRLRQKFGFIGTPIVAKVRHLPVAKSHKAHNVHGPGMEAVAGPLKEKKRLVNQTMRRQKGR